MCPFPRLFVYICVYKINAHKLDCAQIPVAERKIQKMSLLMPNDRRRKSLGFR